MKSTRQSTCRDVARSVAIGAATHSPHWFLTGPASADDLTANEPRIADLVTHAKSMGTNTSACGINTTTWTKLWDIPFDAAPVARRCPTCAALVGEASRERASERRV